MMSESLGQYDLVEDTIFIYDMLNRGSRELRSTMYHESWHRIQGGYMTAAQRRVMDAAFGKQDLEFFSQMKTDGKVQPIEIQARAFENFGTMMEAGLDRIDIRYAFMIQKLDEQFPGLSRKNRGWGRQITAQMYAQIDRAFYALYQFAQRAKNYIDGNGFQSVYDIFKEAYDGRMAATQKYENWWQTMREGDSMTSAEFEALEGDAWTAYAERVESAVDRAFFWDKWSGAANKVVKGIDTQIASLKKQAIMEGC